ncbi:M4 family metallopeptidase [Streptomyces europaeiscabiei]|uniref:M4 family metallopeptidase n=1 Tax=Streptomyces europaeiscabiei TaxID=146819 RepID=UPI0029B635E8|nr:M4 family metallopeptidase [Streptomyces europaeiscabiei]MDX3588297.1 M4 family metallopeptidase [Streptomyces europaeiscabiei]MDX3615028.1 M4 family metallopeptidase [Streptomyces europaeiscabiei]MDX3637556.1 M4 family metallopeptidase [Streptomyces europaeiscabiei]MDX3655443.1 M4 family metallopeptidase [Streptomyces europaeiscabiei]WUD35564.1 M4 family metallopeptidase [Streptomyces europaeiscabiei]
MQKESVLRRQSHRRTSHTGNTFGRSPRRRAAAGALVAVTALLAAAVQSGAATAAPEKAPSAAGKADPGALSMKLTPAQRAELIREANATKAETAEELSLGAKEKLVVRDVLKDRDGTVHTRYERTYDGLPVLGGDLVVETSKAGETEGIVKATKATIKVPSLTPTVTTGKAEKQALGAAKAEDAKSPEINRAPRKVVWAASGKPVLAYETVVGGFQHDGTPQELHVVTDATSGAKLYEWEAVETGTGNTVYSGQVTLGTTQSGSTYNLTDGARGGHKTYNLNRGTSGTGTLFSGPDDVWGNGAPSNLESAGADAHYGAALTWDYYKNVHGRSGIRGDGVGAYSRVHYGNNYVNAFWQDSCFCMTYGDGSGNANPLTSIDVAAHEMTHGLTSNTAGLNYSGESGGLNEATSDIFGSTVEFYAANSSDVGDYLIGEEININGNGTPLRYMDKPSKDGSSKDAWYSGIGSIDVHYSSGPANHFFYLLSEGSGAKTINGVNYDSPTSDGLPVTGIGRAKAEQIWFKALTTKFTSTTNYAAARTGTLAVTGELYGTTSAEYTAVQNAWAGINVGSRPGGGGGGGTSFESTTDVSIPDNGAAVTSPITVSGRTGNAPSNLAVAVDIVHTYVGDLQVQLVAPDGTAYTMKAYGTGGSSDNLNTTYTVNASSEVANGVWQLRVQDNAARDTGHISGWKLTFP